jgi:hypothetical protein
MANDTMMPKVPSTPSLEIKTYTPKPGATTQPKAPMAPAETGHQAPPPPAKND